MALGVRTVWQDSENYLRVEDCGLAPWKLALHHEVIIDFGTTSL